MQFSYLEGHYLINFAIRAYKEHLCKRHEPSDESAKYKLQQPDGGLQNILKKLDPYEIYELCFSQVH